MLKAVYFVEETPAAAACHGRTVAEEMERAVQSLRGMGFESGVRYMRGKSDDQGASGSQGIPGDESASDDQSVPAPEAAREMLFLCGSGQTLRGLREKSLCAAGYSHAENAGESFSGAPYVLQEPDLVDRDSYCKIYEREAGLPWTILETDRCLVREFTAEDLDGIYALYDDEARRFLEPPSEDRAHEREILEAYIRRIYGLYGFGHWAVLEKEPGPVLSGTESGTAAQGNRHEEKIETCGSGAGEKAGCPAPGGSPGRSGRLIGRIGFAVLTAAQEQEALDLGIRAAEMNGTKGEKTWSGLDADFGFLVAASCRGQGIAEEVCRALLQYGFRSLGFRRVRADARADNAASIRLLDKLGFKRAGIVGPGTDGPQADSSGPGRVVFLRERPR
ncbi:MAG: GNAT family N-acetyltransferase [Lachnospiraceae bacterium]|nr:GNAT family N-acetyltransferase [Lachnospiraceae bacterium]